jgi:uncharacterized protein YecE (DUF72 family)
MKQRILVGTASWSDPGFVEHWYPKKMPATERLGWYAQHFEMVEVNSTFYSVPDVRMVERWCAATPDDFIFNVKLHQFFSFHSTPGKLLPPDLRHQAKADNKGKVEATPKLKDAMLKLFLRSISILQCEKKLGSLLLQLSPAFSPRKHSLSELEDFLNALTDYCVAIELRNRNWAVGEQLSKTVEFLRRHRAIFVNVDAPKADHFTILPPELNEVTNSKVAYLRLHGRNAKAYLTGKTVATRFDYDYKDKEIKEITERSKALSGKAHEVYVVFNNNNLDYAPRAAWRLRQSLGQIANKRK